MDKNEITITIAGIANCGKSRITYLIKDMLKEKGFEVKFESDLDYRCEKTFDQIMTSNLNESISSIKNKTKIKIKNQQLKRNNI
jgi:thymidylate kinase